MPSDTFGELDMRTALLHLLATLSYKLGDFTLASGQHSDFYIDCRITTLHAEGGRLAGILLYDLIREHLPRSRGSGRAHHGRRSARLEHRLRQRMGCGRPRGDTLSFRAP